MSDILRFNSCNAVGMTVEHLIRLLEVFPRDMKVVTPGFDEGGFCSVAVSGVVPLRKVPKEEGGCSLRECADGEVSLILNFNLGES